MVIMKIVVDAMGGDYAPTAIIEGVVDAVKEFKVSIVLVGDQSTVQSELNKYDYPKELIEIVHASEAVGMDEPASTPIRKKKDSSISVGVKLLKESPYDAFISAGNTGAVVAASTIYLGMLEGAERPAIGLTIPSLKKFSFLMDAGANTEAKPKHLLQSAIMARVYVKEVLGVENPSVGLVNIGEEATKGSGFAKETYKLLEGRIENFIGNIEANEIYTGKCDCVICDGFVGNIILKVSEGLMESAGKLMKQEIKKSPLAILGAGILKLSLKDIRKLVDYSEYGGAPLLGVNGLVMISHGRSNAKAIKNAIKATIREVEHRIIETMVMEISR